MLEAAKYEEELARRRREPDPPAHPLVTGVYSFPVYGTSAGALARLTIGFLILGILLQVLLVLWPK
jgi:hypothetical protein